MKKFLTFLNVIFLTLSITFTYMSANDTKFPTQMGVTVNDTLPISTGWNLVSVPLATQNVFNLETLLRGKASIAWKFTTAENGDGTWESWLPGDTQKSLQAGDGIFIGIHPDRGSSILEFSGESSENFIQFKDQKFLVGKWYLLGYPTSLSVNEIKTLYPNSVIYIYEGGAYRLLTNGETVNKGQGFWFKVYSTITITSSSSSSAMSSSSSSVIQNSSSSSSSLNYSSSSSSASNQDLESVLTLQGTSGNNYLLYSGTGAIQLNNIIVRLNGTLRGPDEDTGAMITVSISGVDDLASGTFTLTSTTTEGTFTYTDATGTAGYLPISIPSGQTFNIPSALNLDGEGYTGTVTFTFEIYTSLGLLQRTTTVTYY
jgi:hypothetical protein